MEKIAAFDIDGTLAEGPFSPDKIESLRARPEVVKTLRLLLKAGYRISVVTARPDRFREATERWLRGNAIPYHYLTMRRSGDNRPDAVLRAEQSRGTSILFDDKPENCSRSLVKCVRV